MWNTFIHVMIAQYEVRYVVHLGFQRKYIFKFRRKAKTQQKSKSTEPWRTIPGNRTIVGHRYLEVELYMQKSTVDIHRIMI